MADTCTCLQGCLVYHGVVKCPAVTRSASALLPGQDVLMVRHFEVRVVVKCVMSVTFVVSTANSHTVVEKVSEMFTTSMRISSLGIEMERCLHSIRCPSPASFGFNVCSVHVPVLQQLGQTQLEENRMQLYEQLLLMYFYFWRSFFFRFLDSTLV